jgi:hypothetical protein
MKPKLFILVRAVSGVVLLIIPILIVIPVFRSAIMIKNRIKIRMLSYEPAP